MIRSKLKFTLRRLREKLWIKPIGYVLLAVAAVYLAQLTDRLPPSDLVPDISYETLDKLLSVISASMLGVATFAVSILATPSRRYFNGTGRPPMLALKLPELTSIASRITSDSRRRKRALQSR